MYVQPKENATTTRTRTRGGRVRPHERARVRVVWSRCRILDGRELRHSCRAAGIERRDAPGGPAARARGARGDALARRVDGRGHGGRRPHSTPNCRRRRGRSVHRRASSRRPADRTRDCLGKQRESAAASATHGRAPRARTCTHRADTDRCRWHRGAPSRRVVFVVRCSRSGRRVFRAVDELDRLDRYADRARHAHVVMLPTGTTNHRPPR